MPTSISILNYQTTQWLEPQTQTADVSSAHTVNMLCQGIKSGGVDKVILETFLRFRGYSKQGYLVRFNLFVVGGWYPQHLKRSLSNLVQIHDLRQHADDRKADEILSIVAASGSRYIYTWMIPVCFLESLWIRGIKTIPVLYLSHEGENVELTGYRKELVPFVIALTRATALGLKKQKCTFPIHIIKHRTLRRFKKKHLEETKNQRLHKIEPSARLWMWLPVYGADTPKTDNRLFLVCGCQASGPSQQTLLNLLLQWEPRCPIDVCILEESIPSKFLQQIEPNVAKAFSLRRSQDPWDQAEIILAHIQKKSITTLCLWDVDYRVRLILGKVLDSHMTRIVDIRHDVKLNKSDRVKELSARIAYENFEYEKRVDRFIDTENTSGSLYNADATGEKIRICSRVPYVQDSEIREDIRPTEANPDYAVVFTGHIIPNELIHNVLLVSARLRDVDKRVSITLVHSGVPRAMRRYRRMLGRLYEELNLDGNAYFVDCDAQPHTFLRQFKILLTLATAEASTDSAFEAMNAGVPVVANQDGIAKAWIEDGISGILIDVNNVDLIAERIVWLLKHPETAKQIGKRGQSNILRDFNIREMCHFYEKAIWPE